MYYYLFTINYNYNFYMEFTNLQLKKLRAAYQDKI